MTTTILGLKTCDTCRKAIKALPDAAFRDIRADPLSAEERATLIAQFGDAVINRASTTWRGLSDDDKAMDPDDLLAAHPTLMKRPVIQKNGAWYLGWKVDTQKALGL
ncbi:MAG: ArsC family protein [Roseibaca calidilacus]|uniref:ArsC family protein n=1 Tax=Roseibaca calidilacus TaxID=1666912 RepID=A0A0P7WVK2_9RHOB|nr:ArsC/Spx/MgsR family protein [Roseibaca calidilacus]KPP91686.1 MAG: ArsC family protein [Roseibaca calidilacus]CUX82690.1 Arsenate reductase, glutaredoxin family [Roseibaca calidilacus]